ncbi:hypothetical protein OG936_35050 [Streptomyces sp. NBC_00846]|uniref:hypothetical protein n=1 Tax=Streptomyces sp. NBC_00846 TaxID=2975849 RepID=UPI00386ADAEE|nr:hypothetical protein OG936_35050 [Streptomyces sp. NBC_00846]
MSGWSRSGALDAGEPTFRDLRHFADAVLVASGLEPRKVQARMWHARISETLDTYGYLVWEVDWENAPASFEELYGIPAPPGLPGGSPGAPCRAGGAGCCYSR